MHRLVILACSAMKRRDPGYMPAIERYDGPLWQTFRASNPKAAPVACAFVSALYGFGHAERQIQNYDQRMTPETARALIQGGLETRWPRPPSWKHPDNYGNHAGMEISGLTNYGGAPFDDVALVGGELYLEVMRAYVEQFRASGHVTPAARITEINAPIGYMRQQLGAWLQREQNKHGVCEPMNMIRISATQMTALETAGVFEEWKGDGDELAAIRAAIDGDGIAPSLAVWRALNQLANDADELGQEVGREHKDAAMYRADSRSLTALACKVLREARRIEAAKPAIKPPSLAKLKKECRAWNAAHPAYSYVVYAKFSDERIPTRTRGKARVVRDRLCIVVPLEGQSSCVPVEAVQLLPKSEVVTTHVIKNKYGRYFTGVYGWNSRPKFTAKRSEAFEMSDERTSRELRMMKDDSMQGVTVPALSVWRALNPPHRYQVHGYFDETSFPSSV